MAPCHCHCLQTTPRSLSLSASNVDQVQDHVWGSERGKVVELISEVFCSCQTLFPRPQC